jgi:hypothetical protein
MKRTTKDIIKSVILTLWAVFFAHWLSGITGIEALTRIGVIGWIILFVYYLFFVYIGMKAVDSIKI